MSSGKEALASKTLWKYKTRKLFTPTSLGWFPQEGYAGLLTHWLLQTEHRFLQPCRPPFCVLLGPHTLLLVSNPPFLERHIVPMGHPVPLLPWGHIRKGGPAATSWSPERVTLAPILPHKGATLLDLHTLLIHTFWPSVGTLNQRIWFLNSSLGTQTDRLQVPSSQTTGRLDTA